jgi:elongation factor G
METMAEGPLTGSRVRDVRVSLYDGKMHPVDSNEISFKIASAMAFKDAFEKANPMLLEPIYAVEVVCPDDVMGEVMTDLQNRRSIIMGMEPDGHFQKIKALTPLAELHMYATSLRSLSQGRAYHKWKFESYKLVPDNVKDDVLREFQSLEHHH